MNVYPRQGNSGRTAGRRAYAEPRGARAGALTAAVLLGLQAAPALAADAKQGPVEQIVKPPVAQLWMDVATIGGMGMPAGGMMGALTGGLLQQGNAFGNTKGMSGGQWLDIAFRTQLAPNGTDATQAIPPGLKLGDSLPLKPWQPKATKGAEPGGDAEIPPPPKMRIKFYWGCGEKVRDGQPRVLDFQNTPIEKWGEFFQGRAVRDRGAQAKPGHSLWPNEKDRRNVPAGAQLAGGHEVTGTGVPPGLKFQVGQLHDFMPAIRLQQSGELAGSVLLQWPTVTNARAYFMNAMSGGEGGDGVTEMVFWSSAEVPDFGMGLLDYASPANVEKWLKEKVLLPADATKCAVPAGIFAAAGGGMLRMIAYGPELNLADPPRPADKSIPWEPQWAVRVRTKSQAMTMLGMPSMDGADGGAADDATEAAAAGEQPAQETPKKKPSKWDLLKQVIPRP
jgi:hypothetical protein